jgi:hypothetical protein
LSFSYNYAFFQGINDYVFILAQIFSIENGQTAKNREEFLSVFPVFSFSFFEIPKFPL